MASPQPMGAFLIGKPAVPRSRTAPVLHARMTARGQALPDRADHAG
jgi:hypothetical protein